VQHAARKLFGYDQFQWYRERGLTKEYVTFLDAAMLDGDDPERAAYFIRDMQADALAGDDELRKWRGELEK